MSGFSFTPVFLKQYLALDRDLKVEDRILLDAMLARIVATPDHVNRLQSYYDPDHPTWLVREDSFLIHYSFDATTDEVVFLNFFRKDPS